MTKSTLLATAAISSALILLAANPAYAIAYSPGIYDDIPASDGTNGQSESVTSPQGSSNFTVLSQAGGASDSGNGGNGGDSTIINGVSGSNPGGSLVLGQYAYGGAGGNSTTGNGGNGGNATSTLQFTDGLATDLQGTVSAQGGVGGDPPGLGGNGGNALANISLRSTLAGTPVTAEAFAVGGAGGLGSTLGTQGTATAIASASGVGKKNWILARANANGSAGYAKAESTVTGTGSGGGTPYSVSTLAYAPMNNGYAGAAAGTVRDNAGIPSPSAGILPGQAFSLANVVNPAISNWTMGSLGQANASFAVVGAGFMGAQANGGEGSYTYKMVANYLLNGAQVGTGNDLLIGAVKTGAISGDFDSLSLTIKDNGRVYYSGTFSSLGSFSDFFSKPLDLGQVSGIQDVVITMLETLSGTNGTYWKYVLAITPTGSITGGVTMVSAVPIPATLPMFLVAVIGLGVLGRRHFRGGLNR